MNIWLINHYAVPPIYYPLARTTNFAKYLMRMGHTVTIFAASSVHNSDVNLITDDRKWREETVDGVHYVYIKCCDYQGNGLKRIYNICELEAAGRLQALLEARRHCFDLGSADLLCHGRPNGTQMGLQNRGGDRRPLAGEHCGFRHCRAS